MVYQPSVSEDRLSINPKAKALIAKINKAHGEGAILLASDMNIPRRFTSGSLSLDVSLGGGWPANQWVEILGLESHGKTALTLKSIAANQEEDPDFTTLWVAGEHYDSDQATALGVDNDRVIVLPGTDMADAYDTILSFLADRAVQAVVIDSYPALSPPDEINKDAAEEAKISEGAKLTNKFFRKMGASGRRNPHDPTDAPWFGIFINQWRDVIGWKPQGSRGTSPGGLGKNYAFYQRVDVSRVEWIKEKIEGKGKVNVGQTIKTEAFKNKGGPPKRTASIDFYFTDAPSLGFKRGDYDTIKEVIMMGILFDVIKPAGAYYKYGGESWNGLKKLVGGLRDRPDLVEKISVDVRSAAKDPTDNRIWDSDDIEAAKGRVVVKRKS